jgi:hypothetical protein
MKAYYVTITEKFALTVRVIASDEDEAEQIAKRYHDNGSHVVDPNKYIGTTYDVVPV